MGAFEFSNNILSSEGRMGKVADRLKAKKDEGLDASTIITIIIVFGIVIGVGFLVGRYILEWSFWTSLLASPVLFVLLAVALWIWNEFLD
jgi:predicted MFS family arabinose efflux permease